MNCRRWSVGFFVILGFVFSFATATAAEESSAEADGEPESAPTQAEDGEVADDDATGASSAATGGSEGSWRSSTATERVRNAEYALGYHLVSEDVVSDHVAAGFNVTTGSFEGTQLAAGFNIAGESLRGTQISPFFNVLGGDMEGLQFAGLFNNGGGTLRGVQFAGGLNSTGGSMTGLQLAGGLNIAAGDVQGVQLAAFNIARGHVEGAQLGVFNAASSAEVGVGLFNVYWNGGLEAELYGSDDRLMMLGIRHGSKRVYNVYHIGTRHTGQPQMPFAYGMGIGGRVGLGDRVEFSMDATGTSILGGTRRWSWKDQVNLFKVRPIIALQVADTLALFGGPTATLMVNPRPANADEYAQFRTWQLATVEDGADVAIWPGFTFGARLF